MFAPPPERATPAAEDLALAGLGDNVARILRPLTDDQREVILLRLVADLSLADTAEITGKPVTAVKRLQARALRRLQSDLVEDVDEEVS